MDNFFTSVRRISKMSEQSFRELEQISSLRNLKKGDFVLKEGAVCNGIYFVSKGLLRIYYFKHEKEISEWFAFENTFCFSILSYFTKKPSKLIIHCLEDSDVITIAADGLSKLRKENFEIADFAFSLISGSLIYSQERMSEMQFETASQRYKNLIELHPTMIQRVPLSYIASYLGVSFETLSRIRAQLH